MDFFGIGPLELLLIVVVFFLVTGPDKLPGVAHRVGRFLGQARAAVEEAKDAFLAEASTASANRAGSAPEGGAASPLPDDQKPPRPPRPPSV